MKTPATLTILMIMLVLMGPAPSPRISLLSDFHSIVSSGATIITVVGNADLASFPGNGTESDPYIISGASFSDNPGDYCISITNTTAWLIITNCTFHNGTTSAIMFQNVVNATITNCSISAFSTAISLDHCENITITNNTVIDSAISLSLSNTESCVVSNNHLDNGQTGIRLTGTQYITISNNLVSNFSGEGVRNYDNRNYVFNNTFLQSHIGVKIQSGNGNKVIGNHLNGCDYGVFTMDSMFGDISNNTLHKMRYGIYLYGENIGFSISFNAFYPGCQVTAYDTMSENNFFYNFYWDYIGVDENNDGIGDTPYTISGPGNNQDVSPLMNPPSALVNDTIPPTVFWVPKMDRIEYGTNMTISSKIIDFGGVKIAYLSYKSNISDWVNITMNQSGIIWQATIPPQNKTLQIDYKIYACDKKGNWGVSKTWSYLVLPDATPPEVFAAARVSYHDTILVGTNAMFTQYVFEAMVYDTSGVRSVSVFYTFSVHSIQFLKGNRSLEFDVFSGKWTATVEFPKPVDNFTVSFEFIAIDAYGNIGHSLEYELHYVHSTLTETPAPSSPFIVISFSITSAIVIAILIVEVKSKRTTQPSS